MQQHHGGAPPPPPPPPPPPQPGHGGVYAEPPRKNDGIPYIGSRISLISKTDIRYEGFLFNIDTQQSMVALQHVRSFGTEGRRPDHIPPSDQVLPYATFKASEIKDLHVCEAAPPVYGYAPMPPPMPHQPYHPHGVYAQPPLPPGPAATPTVPPPPPVPQPPAPRQAPPPPQSPPKKPVSSAKPKAASSTGPTLLTPGSVSNANNSARPAPQQQQYYHQQKPASPRRVVEAPRNANVDRSGGSRTIPGMGDHLLKRKERRVPGGADGTVSTGQDFNFEQGLTGFDKEEEFSKLDISSDNKAKGSYQKSSFFDTISCDALDRLEGKQSRITSGMERKLNTETFGAVGLNNNRRSFRGGRGGGGRGGYGGRRGRGRNTGSWDGRPREANT